MERKQGAEFQSEEWETKLETKKVRLGKKSSRKELRRRWAEGDFAQSHQIFTVGMFNYFRGPGTGALDGNSHLKY